MSGKKPPKAATAKHLAARRSRGLDGTFSGTCVACLRPTDTGLGVRGDAEWHAAFLVSVGLPEKEAIACAEGARSDCPGGVKPDGRFDMPYQVCERCAARVPSFPKPSLVLPGDPDVPDTDAAHGERGTVLARDLRPSEADRLRTLIYEAEQRATAVEARARVLAGGAS